MTYLSLLLKIALCMSVFVSAFLAVFRQTIDDKKKLTRHGKISVACVCITFSIGLANEFIGIRKEWTAQADKRASDDATLVTRVKLDQALDDGRRRGDEAKAYMLEASRAKSELEIVQGKLEIVQGKLGGIETKIADPTVKKLVSDIKRLTGNDITMTGEKLATVIKIMSDVQDGVVDVRAISVDGRDAARGAKADIALALHELNLMKREVIFIKSQVFVPPRPRDAGIDGWPDGQFFVDDLGRQD